MSLLDEAEALARQGRVDAAVALVTEAARRGDGEGLTILGQWRLWGIFGARDLPLARECFARAAATGRIDAALIDTALVANGAGAAPDWTGGLARLHALAGRSEAADRQLRLIGAMAIDGDGRPTALPSARRIDGALDRRLYPGLLTPAECAYLMAAATPQLQPSMIIDASTGRPVPHPTRKSDGMNFGPSLEDPVVHAINRRLAAVSGTEAGQGEPLHVLRYGVGQQYLPHLDALPGEANQRLWTVLVYLNDGYEGGETEFADGERVRGAAGDALLFANLDDGGRPDPRSRHAGRPVTQGIKWLATRWIRQRPYQAAVARR